MANFGYLEKFGIVFLLGLLFYIVKCVVNVVYTYIIGPAVNKVDFKSKGKWALITGSTDGIGKAYARESSIEKYMAIYSVLAYAEAEGVSNVSHSKSTGDPRFVEIESKEYSARNKLASRGCDIILVSRSMDKLKETATEIENDYKVNTKIVQADFIESDSIFEKISKEVSDLEIGTIVNNVGVSYKYPEYFLDLPDWEQSINAMLKANIVSVTRMTGIVLPGMVKRGKGVVINIGSGSSIIPSPLLSVYASSKAYVEKFTEGLDMEYSKKGIIVQCVLPGFVCSNMSGIRRSTIMAPTAKTFVKSALSLVGTTSKTTGYFPHTVLFYLVNTIHGSAYRFSVWLVTRSMENTRMKALKKYKKQ